MIQALVYSILLGRTDADPLSLKYSFVISVFLLSLYLLLNKVAFFTVIHIRHINNTYKDSYSFLVYYCIH